MEATAVTRNNLITTLVRSPHGALNEYLPIIRAAVPDHSDFLAHLIVWNLLEGQIRDSKVAIPVITLSARDFPDELTENSLAALATLDPRNFLKAVRFAYRSYLPHGKRVLEKISRPVKDRRRMTADVQVPKPPPATVEIPGAHLPKRRLLMLRQLVRRYLRAREENWGWWTRSAVQHRRSMKELYGLAHLQPSPMADQILFKENFPKGSVFADIHNLKLMSPAEAAGVIMTRKLPFLVIQGALGAKLKDTSIALALIGRMSPTELVTNTDMLDRLGVKTVPALRSAYQEALNRAGSSKANVLKTTRAAENVEDEESRQNLRGLQEKQLASMQGIEGNWAVLVDKSGSMAQAMELGRMLAAALSKLVRGKVLLIFFDTQPYIVDASGLDYDKIKEKTARMTAGGGTSIGCALLAAIERQTQTHDEIDGIVIASDGAENSLPFFVDQYKVLSQLTGKQVPVYLYRTEGEDGGPGDIAHRMRSAGLDLQQHDLRRQTIDFYGVLQLAKTMRTNRYGLLQQIMDLDLLTIEKVLPLKKEEALHA